MRLRLIFSCCMAAIVAATGCGTTGGYNMPPASRLMEPGPGVGGPGPGVMMPGHQVMPVSYQAQVGGGVVGGAGCVGDVAASAVPATEVQVLFARPEAMQVSFGSGGGYNSAPLITPARQNFMQGGVYRLKVTGIPGREGTELYPTLELGPPTRGTAAYLAHNAIPVQFTEEDLDQVTSGNFVTKVIYLPEPDFQELALAGVETLVSTRLDPGVDPLVEADRRGSILAVVRIGNKDMEIPGGSSVTPMYGATQAAPSQVVPAAHLAPITRAVRPAPAPMPAASPAPVTRAAVAPAAVGAGVAAPANSQVAQASFGAGVACDDAGASGGCQSCGGGCPSGGCLAGMINAPSGVYYGPNSTPRGGHGPGGLPPGLARPASYGMPITGTPIGLPGPPHVPLGVPAGLKKHVMHNWTARHIPDPVKKLKINVKQRPGLSYPQPPTRAWIVEDTIHAAPKYSHRHFGPAKAAAPCPDGSCPPAKGGLLSNMKGLLGHH